MIDRNESDISGVFGFVLKKFRGLWIFIVSKNSSRKEVCIIF